MGNFLKYEISTEPEGPQTADYARKAALPALLISIVLEVDPACRAEIKNCTPLCGISEQGKITVNQPWHLRKAEPLSPIPISYTL
jgi:hypothetical protein